MEGLCTEEGLCPSPVVMIKMENGGHFGRHLEFRRELQGILGDF